MLITSWNWNIIKHFFFSTVIGRLLTFEGNIFPNVDIEHEREECHHSNIKSSFKYPCFIAILIGSSWNLDNSLSIYTGPLLFLSLQVFLIELIKMGECSSGWSNPLFQGCHLIPGDHPSDLADQHHTQDALKDLPIFPSPPSIAIAVSLMLPPAQHPNIPIFFLLQYLIQSIE